MMWRQDTIVHPLHSVSRTQLVYFRILLHCTGTEMSRSMHRKAASTTLLSWINRLQPSCACPEETVAQRHTSAEVTNNTLSFSADVDLLVWVLCGNFVTPNCDLAAFTGNWHVAIELPPCRPIFGPNMLVATTSPSPEA